MESSNTNNSSFNEFEDLGAETRRYMAEHMDGFLRRGARRGLFLCRPVLTSTAWRPSSAAS